MAIISFIANRQTGEPDILTTVKHMVLTIQNENGVILKSVPAPASGWTNELLQQHEKVNTSPSDAFISDVWVGSTEV